jgi:hypothetical protein
MENLVDTKGKLNISSVLSAQKEDKVPIIGTYEQADEYLRDNEFIHKGYRINYQTFWLVMKSLFMCHNETVNIWTHLLGLIGFF